MSASLTRKHHSWGLPALPFRNRLFITSFFVKMGAGGLSCVPFPLPSSQRSSAANRGLNKMVSSFLSSFQAPSPTKNNFFPPHDSAQSSPDKNVNASWSKDKRWWGGTWGPLTSPFPQRESGPLPRPCQLSLNRTLCKGSVPSVASGLQN